MLSFILAYELIRGGGLIGKEGKGRGLREGRTGATKDQRDTKARRYYLEW